MLQNYYSNDPYRHIHVQINIKKTRATVCQNDIKTIHVELSFIQDDIFSQGKITNEVPSFTMTICMDRKSSQERITSGHLRFISIIDFIKTFKTKSGVQYGRH